MNAPLWRELWLRLCSWISLVPLKLFSCILDTTWSIPQTIRWIAVMAFFALPEMPKNGAFMASMVLIAALYYTSDVDDGTNVLRITVPEPAEFLLRHIRLVPWRWLYFGYTVWWPLLQALRLQWTYHPRYQHPDRPAELRSPYSGQLVKTTADALTTSLGVWAIQSLGEKLFPNL